MAHNRIVPDGGDGRLKWEYFSNVPRASGHVLHHSILAPKCGHALPYPTHPSLKGGIRGQHA
eukprot:1161924-Pelagomonas_calceolata.AAC.5